MERDATVGLSLGARLRAARERVGWSQVQVSEKLHLEPRIVAALESDDYEALGAPVYVRGHVRRYAELLGEPSGPLIDLYSRAAVSEVVPDLTQVPRVERGLPPQRLGAPVIAVIVGVALLAGVWVALRGLPAAPPRAPAPAAAPAASADSLEPASVATSAPAVTEATGVGPEPPADGIPESAARVTDRAGPVTPDAPTAGTAATGPPTSLRLAFTADSWVEVTDARGQRLFFDIGSANSSMTLTGQAPLRVLLGYAPGVALEVDGRAIEVPSNTRRGDAAEFVVASSGAVSRR
jgi:cytoskeleton protein RodZ